MIFPRHSFVVAAAIALALAGCAQNQGNLFASAGGSSAKPKTVLVADFVAASEVTATDNGFNTRLERKGNYPILERRQRTLARVNDEIVATTIADLRAAGLEAQPGNETNMGLGDDALLVTGRLEPPDKKRATQVGFGPGRGNVVADMTVTRASVGSRVPVTTFAVDVQSGRKIPAGNKQAITARDSAIAATLVTENALPERLSPDVEAQARALGRAIAEKIVAYAKEHDWLSMPQVADATPAAAPGGEQRVRLPDAKPAPKVAAAKPQVPKAAKPATAKRKDPLAPEDEEPPDTDVPDQDKQ